MTPQQFIAKWGPGGPAFDLNERQGAQPHFIDLCQLLGVPTPGSAGDYIFEQDTLVLGEARGYADVFKRDYFAWENKAPGKNLDTALKQLLTYSLALSNPPLLVVCDRLTIRIHTQFNGHPSETHTVLLQELDQPEKLALLRRVWLNPGSFRPKKTSRDITEAAAKSFALLAEGLRKRGAGTPEHADEVAHFLTQCLFCFFAEDVGLLPGRMFEGLVNNKALTSDKLATGLNNLFTVMRDGGLYGNDDIPWFNGGLFKKIKVPALTIMDMAELRNAAALNWSAIDVSIFGTLFERGLDPSKRSQLGAHYTDPATIMRIVEPVLSRPLLQKWELVTQEIRGLVAKSTRKNDKHYNAAKARFVLWLEDLKAYRVLDPACGSGNFLFLGLKALKDIEHRSHLDAAALGLDREADLVTGPHNVLGIELNEYAAELARVTVWIGELQWRMAHGYDFKTNPVLEPLDHIECRDALLCWTATPAVRPELVEGIGADYGVRAGQTPPTSAPPTPLRDLSGAEERHATEATWPKASVVIGNPPFLGDKKMRSELGDDYTQTLRKTYEGRVPGGADLVCYWFEKARKAIETNGLGAAGLVSTNSIRGGKNRAVLDAIAKTTRIYEAWSDESWVNEGAAVRVSLIAFGHATQEALLDGHTVGGVHADLTAGQGSNNLLDVTSAQPLPANRAACFIGGMKKGPFDVSGETARDWLRRPNPNGKSNANVVRPWLNGLDVTRRPLDQWIVDFGLDRPEAEAALYEAPFAHVVRAVRPKREAVRNELEKSRWWLHARPAPDLRHAVASLGRSIATARVAKYRLFVWLQPGVVVDGQLVVTARADDTTFGILHSRFHELWSLRMGTSLEDRPRYTPTTCFETFPFPAGLTPADTAHQRTETLEGGTVIPADISEQNRPPDPVNSARAAIETVANAASSASHLQAGAGRRTGAISKSAAYEPPASAALPPGQRHTRDEQTGASTGSARTGEMSLRTAAIAIAQAAKQLNEARENWLNPKEWTHKVKEITPLGMDHSPYPDRIEPKPGLSEEDLKTLQKRTLTSLYNLRPSWLVMAHNQLDQAVATAYGWTDYTADMPDEEILKRLLALNLQRSASAAS
ncbi:MAG: hypothetical protein RL211_1229 [Pseudomonadota bacterium]